MASPPINSTYSRQIIAQTRRTSGRARAATPADDGLDDTSLAPWWNTDRYINSNINSTPFRNQKYEPLKWAGADLLMDEDGEEFLVDDPFATPATAQKGRNVGSAKRRRSSLATELKASLNGLPSPSPALRQRNLTLADLTPKSRRISQGGRTNRTPRRSSVGKGRTLRLSKDGPGFGPLLPIQEDLSRIDPSPAREPFGQETPKGTFQSPRPDTARTPVSRKPRRSSKGVKHDVPTTSTPTTITPVAETSKAAENSGQSRRKSRRSSVVPFTAPTEGDDDEELHRSIPGAFDFSTEHQVQPLPSTIFNFSQQPEPTTSKPIPKSRPVSRRPSSAVELQPVTGVPTTSLGGLAGRLVEYGDMLMGLINPTDVALAQPPLKTNRPRAPALQLSDLSPHKEKTSALNKEKKRISSHVSKPVATVEPVKKRSSEHLHTRRLTSEQITSATMPKKPAQSRMPIPRGKEVQKVPEKVVVPPPAAQPIVSKRKIVPSSDAYISKVIVQEGKTVQGAIQDRQSLLPAFELNKKTTESEVHEPTHEEDTNPVITSSSRNPQYEQPYQDAQYTGTQHLMANIPAVSVSAVAPASPLPRLPDAPSSLQTISRTRRSSLPAAAAQEVIIPEEIRRINVSPSRRAMTEQVSETPTSATLPQHEAPTRQRRPSALVAIADDAPAELSMRRESRPTRLEPEQNPGTVFQKQKSDMMDAKQSMNGPASGKRPLKSILKKRPLEVSPRKSGLERASKRQRVLEPRAANVLVEEQRSHDARSRNTKIDAPKKPRSQSRRRDEEEMAITPLVLSSLPERSFDRSHETRVDKSLVLEKHGLGLQLIGHDFEEDVFGTVVENSMELSFTGLGAQERPETRRVEEGKSLPQPFVDGTPIFSTTTFNVLRPTAAQNLPEQQPSKSRHLPTEVAKVVHTTEQLLPDRLFAYGTRDKEPCRLTVPQSPNFMRVQREKEREKAEKERERLEQLERQLDQQRRERVKKIQQRGMPPVAAALLAKLAGVKGGSEGQKVQDTKRLPSREFTFVSDLRPMLGRDGAASAEQVHKEQFMARRNLWEQRSLEASQASSSSSKSRDHERTTQVVLSIRDSAGHLRTRDVASIRHSNAEGQDRASRESFVTRPARGAPSNATARMAEREQRRRERAMPITAREQVINQTRYLLGGRQSPRRRGRA